MTFKIREACLDDANEICELNRLEMGYDYSLKDTIKRLSTLISNPEHKIYVGVYNDNVVGYIHACNYDLTFSPPLKNILGIAVNIEYKRHVIGRALLEAVEQWAISDGAVGVRIISGATRVGAHEFYHKCGYSQDKKQINLKKLF